MKICNPMGLVLVVASFSAFGADYYVATNGSDSASGTLGAPWQTIQKAATVMTAGDTCTIRGGTYRETVTPANSGTSGNPITYQAYSGETVVITGLEPVSGWTSHSGSIYKADLTWSLDHEDQVFVVDGTNVTYLWEARWPNITEYSFDGLRAGFATADSGSVSTLVDNALSQPNDYWNGATVWYIGGKGGWLGKTSLISDFAGGTLTLANTDSTRQDPTNGSEYYLSGILNELDVENEWYIDAGNNEIYLWAPGGGVPDHIEVKSRLEGMILQNVAYIHVEGIDFLAANIQLENADYCMIDDINARYIYGSDKSLSYSASNQREGGINVVGDHNTIRNSELSYTTGSMVQLKGSGNKVVNNHIHHTTMLGNYASAIQIDTGDSHLISHNTIHDVGRCAFSSTKEVYKSIIQHNRIYDYMWLSSDGAAIYVWGMDMGNTEFRYNIISDGHGVLNGWGHKATHGIYMDNGVNNVLIHHNVIYDVGDSTSYCIKFNQPGNYRVAYNNTLVDSTGGSFDTGTNGSFDPDLFGCVLNNNILTESVTQHAELLFEDNITSDVGLNLNGDYSLQAGSTAIDYGADEPSISDNYLTSGLGYEGDAPDAGAYEFGAAAWTAGHDFINLPTPDFTPRTSQYMNLLLGSGFDVLDDWVPAGSPSIGNFDLSKSGLNRGFRKWLQLNGSTGEGVEQIVTGLKPNTEYRLSGWVFCDAGEEIKFGVRNYGDVEMSQTAVNTAYDARRDLFFTTGASDTQAAIFITKTSTGSGNVYADDFGLVEQIYEPLPPEVEEEILFDDFNNGNYRHVNSYPGGSTANFWGSRSQYSEDTPGSRLVQTIDSSGENYNSGNSVSSAFSTNFSFFDQTMRLKVRGISFDGTTGTGTDLADTQMTQWFTFLGDHTVAPNAQDSLWADVRADGRVRLKARINGAYLDAGAGNAFAEISVANMTGFDLTLEPGTTGTDYDLKVYGVSTNQASGNISGLVKADWGAGNGGTKLGLWAQEQDGIQPGAGESIMVSRVGSYEIVSVTYHPWAAFAADYGLSGNPVADFDNDGLLDYGEYVFGGNPTNGADVGTQPVFDGATGNYIFSLIGDDTVVAYVVSTTNLIDGAWATNDTVNVLVNDGVLDTYTNNVGTSEDQLFIKLEIKAP